MTAGFQLAETLQHLRTRWQYRGGGPIIVVHQMARVGSKTIRFAIRRRLPVARSFHTHYLNPETIDHFRGRFVRRYERTGRPGLYKEHLHACWLADRMERHDYGDWLIVSLVRDPVARTISAFFRHLPLNHPELGEGFRDDPSNAERLIEMFQEPGEPEHGFALEWFDREVRDVFGIDLLSGPIAAGGGLYSCDAGRLLVLRMEDLPIRGAEILGSFLGTGPVELGHEGRTADLSYAQTWARFMARLRLRPEYLDRMYGSRLARRFYDAAEIAAFRRRWSADA